MLHKWRALRNQTEIEKFEASLKILIKCFSILDLKVNSDVRYVEPYKYRWRNKKVQTKL